MPPTTAIRKLLLGWGQSEPTIAKFEEDDITVECLPFLDEETLVTLIPKKGPRLLFNQRLQTYMVSEVQSTSHDKTVDDDLSDNAFDLTSTNTVSGTGPRTTRATIRQASSTQIGGTSGKADDAIVNDLSLTATSTETAAQKVVKPTGGSSTSDDVDEQDSSTITGAVKRKGTEVEGSSGPSKKRLALQPEGCVNQLHASLLEHPEGLTVISHFNTKGSLNTTRRDELSARIIYTELKGNLSARITRERFEELAHQIVELFPTESTVTWYDVQAKRNKTIVSGRLKYKFYNIRRTLIKVGLITSGRLQHELADDEDLDLSTSDANEDEDILWLTANDSPFIEVLKRWENSVEVRKVFKRDLSISEYISKFYFLQQRNGWELLVRETEADRKEWKDKKGSWLQFMQFVEIQLKECIPKFDAELAGLEDEARIVAVLLKISHLFKPRTLPKGNGASVKDKSWRPSRAEVQSSMFIHLNEPGQLRDLIKTRKDLLLRYHLTLQPFVVAIGNPIRQYLICVDGRKWEVKSALEGMDVCFKVFFALNSQYPSEARHMWLFIQRTVYQLELETDYTGDKGLKSFIASHLKSYETYLEDLLA